MKAVIGMGWDMTIASIHNLLVRERPRLVNGNETEFKPCLDKNFRDIRSLCRAYYHTIQEAIQTEWFDVVDLLDIIKGQGMKLEINTGALAHPTASTYPSPGIVRSAQEKGIPLVIGSDAHRPAKAVGQGFN